MAELYPSDGVLNAMAGDGDAEQEVRYPDYATDEPHYTPFYKMLQRLLKVARRSGDLRVFKDGALTFGVRACRYFNGDTAVNYSQANAQALTDNQTNYIYLTAAGVLTVNTTGFPVPSVTPYIPLATIVTASGEYDGRDLSEGGDVTDYRGRSIFQICGAAGGSLNALDWQESVADELDFTAAEPAAPTLGDRYLNTGTGASSGTGQTVAANDIEEWNGTSWTEITPTEGACCLVEDRDMLIGFNGSAWIDLGTFANIKDLTDGGNADALHGHDTAGLEDDAVTAAKLAAGAPHATLFVAASDAPAKARATADYLCDGTADQVQINLAITALASTGGIVQLSTGTFDCPNCVSLNQNNVTLRGMGPATILQKTGAGTDHVVYQTNQANHHITAEDFQIDGNNIGDQTDSFNKGIFFNGCSADYATAHHFAIRRVIVHDARSEGICIDFAQHCVIEDCYSYNNSWAGVTFAQVKQGTIRGNHCDHNGEYNASGSLAYGINTQSSEFIEVYDNYVEDNQHDGAIGVSWDATYSSYPARDVNVHDNHLSENLVGTAIRVTSPSGDQTLRRISIHDNHLYDTAGAVIGIYIEDVVGFEVRNNFLNGNGAYGVYIKDPADQGVIDGNDILTYTAKFNVSASATNIHFNDSRVTRHSSNYTVLLSESGQTLTATKADGVMTFSLPVALVGMNYNFVRGDAGAGNDVRIDPNGTETIQKPDGTVGGAGKYLENTSDEIGSVSLACRTAGAWQVIASQGTWALQM